MVKYTEKLAPFQLEYTLKSLISQVSFDKNPRELKQQLKKIQGCCCFQFQWYGLNGVPTKINMLKP